MNWLVLFQAAGAWLNARHPAGIFVLDNGFTRCLRLEIVRAK
jgi:glycosylphosphatidylinositol transamidase (GPIT) subunit GPI8